MEPESFNEPLLRHHSLSRRLLITITILVVPVAIALLLSFSQDQPSLGRYVFQAACLLISVGLVVASASPNEGRWCLRIVTGVIALTYIGWVVDSLNHLGSDLHAWSLFRSVCAFLFWGLPSTLHTVTGHWGPSSLDTGDREMDPTEQLVWRIRMAGMRLLMFLTLSAFILDLLF